MRFHPRFPHAVGISFVILAFATTGGLALNATESTRLLEVAQVTACNKANELRAESNQRIRSHMVLREAAEDALKSQAIARRAAYRKTKQEADRVAAHRAEDLLNRIEQFAIYNETPQVRCDKLISKDTSPFGF